jgi:hypothetical protein
VRVSLSCSWPEEKLAYVLDAVAFVAAHGWRFMPHYIFYADTGEWRHRTIGKRSPHRRWLHNIDLAGSSPVPASGPDGNSDAQVPSFAEALLAAQSLLELPLPGTTRAADTTLLSETAIAANLRWFALPSEATALLLRRSSSTSVDPTTAVKQGGGGDPAEHTISLVPNFVDPAIRSGPLYCPLVAVGGAPAPIPNQSLEDTLAAIAVAAGDDGWSAATEKEAFDEQGEHPERESAAVLEVSSTPNGTQAHEPGTPAPTSTAAAASLQQASTFGSDERAPLSAASSSVASAAATEQACEQQEVFGANFEVDAHTTCAPEANTQAHARANAEHGVGGVDRARAADNGLVRPKVARAPGGARLWPAVPKALLRPVGMAIRDFGMIRDGDRVLLGLSGGKDSLSLLHVLHNLQQRAPIRFELAAVTMDPQFPGFDPSPLIGYMRTLGIPYFFESQPMMEIAKATNPSSICSWCSRMKREL